MNKNIPLRPVSLLLLNGGIGTRVELGSPKQFYEIHGHPMMAYAIIAATRVEAIQEIVVNAPAGFAERTQSILEHYCAGIPTKLVEGAPSRQNSTYKLVEAASHDRILLHETARPIISAETYQELLDHAEENVGYFTDIPFSMCRLDPKTQTIRKNVRRDRVFNIQLPQKFDRSTLLAAHKAAKAAKRLFTEDAVLVHKMADVLFHALPGDQRNIKVTTAKDLKIASQLMNERLEP